MVLSFFDYGWDPAGQPHRGDRYMWCHEGVSDVSLYMNTIFLRRDHFSLVLFHEIDIRGVTEPEAEAD